MRYFLFKLAGKSDQDLGKPWAIYEYTNATFENKLTENPFIVSEIYCSVPSTTHKFQNAYYVATCGSIRIDEHLKAWIT